MDNKLSFGPDIVIAKSGGICRDDLELEYAPKGTSAKLAALKQLLGEAEPLIKLITAVDGTGYREVAQALLPRIQAAITDPAAYHAEKGE